MLILTDSEAQRFWSKVSITDSCWLWTAATTYDYGVFYFRGKLHRAHRLSWEMHVGPIPAGLHVCHDCPDGDNPGCINPAHLFLGTATDNLRDMRRKGRGSGGSMPKESNPNAKITQETVDEIRRLREEGLTTPELGRMFGLSKGYVWKIVNHWNWT